MHRTFRTFEISASSLLLVTTLACSGSSPVAPENSGAAPGTTTAAPDGSTLKANQPTPISPGANQTVETVRPTLQISPATGRFVGANFSYEFEVLTASGASVTRQTVSGTSWTVPTDLQLNTPYGWRARAVMAGAVGPWSSTVPFRTHDFVLPGCVGGRLVDAKAYFFHLIGRKEGDPAGDWRSVLQRSGLPAGPVAGQRIPDNAPFYGLSQQIDSSGTLRGRVFLPTNSPDEFGYFIHHIEVLSDPSGGRWIWQPIGTAGGSHGAPPYAPKPCP